MLHFRQKRFISTIRTFCQVKPENQKLFRKFVQCRDDGLQPNTVYHKVSGMNSCRNLENSHRIPDAVFFWKLEILQWNEIKNLWWSRTKHWSLTLGTTFNRSSDRRTTNSGSLDTCGDFKTFTSNQVTDPHNWPLSNMQSMNEPPAGQNRSAQTLSDPRRSLNLQDENHRNVFAPTLHLVTVELFIQMG